MNNEINETNLTQEQLDEQFQLNEYNIQATEIDMRTIAAVFGTSIQERLASEDKFEQIDARIETLFATSHILLRLSLLNKEALNVNDKVGITLNKLALVYAEVAKNLLDKNDASFEEGIFNELTKEDLDPIMDVLNNINVDLPEGL